MTKYRKKPVVIEAFVWTGDKDDSNIPSWMWKAIANNAAAFEGSRSDPQDLFIRTLEGKMKASIGDYIIKGIRDEVYPCKPDIFKDSYELAAPSSFKRHEIQRDWFG
ncbi:hypothetical protein N9137_01085 [Pseudomonadales bacterium]|nr:hypothetical protein [Pseudomonadales bacterium]